ncbi:M13 family metallopeptidase [Thalassotalea atypica]|uniref:M13 family metallopeptidase n=1 Tax=Thalassotalea atypica TaxID=2054316 RepID=UPI00257291A8|nr:M13-type metalloendopeptidase [Thalassotalea atypica]
MRKVLQTIIMLLAVSGCSQAIIAKHDNKKNSGVLTEGMNRSVKPGDDFNAYVNGNWIEQTEIPEDKSKYGLYPKLRDVAQANVKFIIEESARGQFSVGSDRQKVGDLYRSFMDLDTRNIIGISPLKTHFDTIDAIENHHQLAVLMAQFNILKYGGPFGIHQYVDFKSPNTYMIYSWQEGLGLPDRAYYLEEGQTSEEIRQKYKQHIEVSLSLVEFEEPASAAATIYKIEEKLAQHHISKEQNLDMVAIYNKVPIAELDQLMPDFNWQGYLAEMQLTKLDALVVTQLDYMKAFNDIFQSTSLVDWKLYMKWRVTNATADRLTGALDKQHFNFYSKVLRGVETQQPMWRRGVNVVNDNIGEVVGKVYVTKHFTSGAKQHMYELVNNLLTAYEDSIKKLDWMTDKTKVQALDKLSKFTVKIGYPDKWKDYSALTIDKKDLFGNLERSAQIIHKQKLEKQKGPVRKHEWGMNPQTVNAYYYPPLNEIVFPAAILQPPFFDMNAEDAINYGAIGSIIGHEIAHGFDASGSAFDGDGVLRDWWTEKDKDEFDSRVASLIEQYDSFKPFDDLHVNGEFTLDENIGDLSGISIGLKAYQLSLNGKAAPVIDGFSGEQRVFIGFAQVWRNKYREKALRHQINTDEHAPSMYRVNGAVRNVPEFYSAFDVKEEDAMYLTPKRRVKIW